MCVSARSEEREREDRGGEKKSEIALRTDRKKSLGVEVNIIGE